VNGSEKVLIAQERQAYNRVYCFRRRQPSKASWTAEIRSDVQRSNRPLSYFELQMLRKGSENVGHQGHQIHARVHSLLRFVPGVAIAIH
jgi:DNA-directed RNA polymerase beta subunit